MNLSFQLLVVIVIQLHLSYQTKGSDVTASKIVNKARSFIDSTDWSKSGCKHGSRFCGTWKCNLFVYDVLKSVGAKVPTRRWWIYSPIGANEWGNPNSGEIKNTGCYTLIPSFYQKRSGDIIAFPQPSGSGHVGIVYSSNEYISAKRDKVEKTGYPNTASYPTRTIWRYKYNKNGC
ncbi:uncharacterized protein LOC127725582 [Mytilus californianus]|uniref:uncharacterized protein LOC127725582 n=1 Tax=Mytilus californianus TaxID=6549 RepID=UPI0022472F68|nr:uncharacterized protein LOC127725582 [Mytilus californianus]